MILTKSVKLFANVSLKYVFREQINWTMLVTSWNLLANKSQLLGNDGLPASMVETNLISLFFQLSMQTPLAFRRAGAESVDLVKVETVTDQTVRPLTNRHNPQNRQASEKSVTRGYLYVKVCVIQVFRWTDTSSDLFSFLSSSKP